MSLQPKFCEYCGRTLLFYPDLVSQRFDMYTGEPKQGSGSGTFKCPSYTDGNGHTSVIYTPRGPTIF